LPRLCGSKWQVSRVDPHTRTSGYGACRRSRLHTLDLFLFLTGHENGLDSLYTIMYVLRRCILIFDIRDGMRRNVQRGNQRHGGVWTRGSASLPEHQGTAIHPDIRCRGRERCGYPSTLLRVNSGKEGG